jgi:membrane-associated phospholipid phosphatase
MPSLHAGVPLLILMMAFREFGWRAWWFTIVVAGICFEIVYGAEHYMVDVMAGFIYAILTYVIVFRILLPDNRLGEADRERGGG